MANVLGGPTICQRMNTAGTNLQNKLNERGVSCTYGKTTDGKLDIDGLADLITSSNLKGANDALISITASRPYLLSGETTDLIVHLTNGLGAPLANKEVTIENSLSIGAIDEIFTVENWSSGNIGGGVFTIGSSYAYMISEFTDLTHYTLNFHVYDVGNLEADVFFGAATTGSGDGIGIKGNGGFIFTIYKIVDNVETVLGYFNIQSLVQGNDPIPLVVKRDGNTITLNDYSVTSSSLKNTIKAKNCEFYEDELSLVSLYTGITNNLGLFTLYDMNSGTFTATYSGQSSSCTVYGGAVFYDNATSQSKNTHWKIRSSDQSDLTVAVSSGGTTLTNASTSASRFYFANPEDSTSNSPPISISDFVVEVDIFDSTFSDSDSQISFLLQGQTTPLNLKSYTAPYHIKIEKEGTSAKHYINDTLIRTTTIADRTNYYAGFQLYKRASITLRDYVIREI